MGYVELYLYSSAADGATAPLIVDRTHHVSVNARNDYLEGLGAVLCFVCIYVFFFYFLCALLFKWTA